MEQLPFTIVFRKVKNFKNVKNLEMVSTYDTLPLTHYGKFKFN